MEKYLKIPIIKELKDTFGFIDIKQCYNEYINEETLSIYDFLNNELLKYRQIIDYCYLSLYITNEKIYNYIKFIDYSGLEFDEYVKISKFITNDNYMYFSTLFENININDNLHKVLNYDIIKLYPKFDKNKWVIYNFNNINYDSKILEEYLKFNGEFAYYLINNKIYVRYKIFTLCYYYCDINKCSHRGNLKVNEHKISILNKDLAFCAFQKSGEILEIILKYMNNENIEIDYMSVMIHCKKNLNNIKVIIENAKLNNFDISKLIMYNNNFLLKYCLIYDNFDFFKYIIDNGGDYKYNMIYRNKLKYIKYIYDKFQYIDFDEIISQNILVDLELVKYLMNIDINYNKKY